MLAFALEDIFLLNDCINFYKKVYVLNL
jgi:hypothetical protein